MPFDIAGIGPGKPVLGRHISDLYGGLTGTMTDQPITLGSTLGVKGKTTLEQDLFVGHDAEVYGQLTAYYMGMPGGGQIYSDGDLDMSTSAQLVLGAGNQISFRIASSEKMVLSDTGLLVKRPLETTSSLTVGQDMSVDGTATINNLNVIGAGVGLPDGTAPAPSLFFTSDTNTGLYKYGADQLGISTGGVARWYFSGPSLLVANEATFPYIGASGANRPFGAYFVRSVEIGAATQQSADIVLNSVPSGASGWKTIAFRTNSLARFALFVGPSETGSNAGGDMIFTAYNDAGNFLSQPITITRSTGLVGIGLLNSPVLQPQFNVIEQRNGVNPQTLRVYNTFTDTSNYSRLTIGPGLGNNSSIFAEVAGTGTNVPHLWVGTKGAGNIFFQMNGTDRWSIDSVRLNPGADNTYDIGVSGTSRVRNIYVGTSVDTPVLTATQVTAPSGQTLQLGLNGVPNVWQFDLGGTLRAITDNARDIGSAGSQRPRNLYLAGAVGTKTKAGTPVDADLSGPVDGMLAVDTTNNLLYFRSGAIWRSAASGGGLTLPLTQNLTFSPDNTYDIGTVAASRPRNLWLGGTANAANFQSGSTYYGDGFILPGGNVIEQRNGTSGQTFRIYNTYTDASNYERGFVRWALNVFEIGNEIAGTGVSRDVAIQAWNTLTFRSAATDRWRIGGVGNLVAVADNTYDIGAAGATRPRSIYAATSFIGPGAVPTGGTAGQVLSKNTATNYDVIWITPTGGGGVTWPLLAPDGTAAAPNYSFTNDTGMGLYRRTAGQIGISAGGVESAVVTAATLYISQTLSFGANPGASDVQLWRETSDVLAQRRGTNAQTLRIYGSYTDASNWQRLTLNYQGVFNEFAGTGAAQHLYLGAMGANQDIYFRTNGADRWWVHRAGSFLAGVDNAYDIGISTGLRPRNIYQAGGTFQSYNPGAGIANDGTNYERGSLSWTSNLVKLFTEQGGTGLARSLYLGTTGADGSIISFRTNNVDRWAVFNGGTLASVTDSGNDIGQPASNRPRNIYQAGGVFQSYNPGAGIANDGTNYERGSLVWGSNDLYLRTEVAGTGVPRNLILAANGTPAWVYIMTNSVLRWQFTHAGHFLATADNVYDIGASGANRPRTIYAGTNVQAQATVYGGAGYTAQFPGGALYALASTHATSRRAQIHLGGGWQILQDVAGNGTLDLGFYSTTVPAFVMALSPLGAMTTVPVLSPSTNAIEQRNGTSAQTYYLYNTYTDAANYERASFYWGANTARLVAEQAGTGVARQLLIGTVGATDLFLSTNNTTRWRVDSGGLFLAVVDNTYDIGWSGANFRPRDLWLARNAQVAGQVLLPSTTPALAFTAGTTTGFGSSNPATHAGVSVAGALVFRFDALTGAHRLPSTQGFGWSSTTDPNSAGNDTILYRGGAGIIEQRNGTSAQKFSIYNTYTDALNYERLGIGWSANAIWLLSEQAGTGTARSVVIGTTGSQSMNFQTNGVLRWYLPGPGHLWAVTDNTLDIGASGANRPRDLWLGRDFQMNQATPGNAFLGRTGVMGGIDPSYALRVQGDTFFSGTISGFPSLSTSGSGTFGGPVTAQYMVAPEYRSPSSQDVTFSPSAGQRWVIQYVDGAFRPWVDNAVDIGIPTLRPRHLYLAGFLGIGIASGLGGDQIVSIVQSASAGTSQWGIRLVPTFSSAATGTGRGVSIQSSTAASAFTMAELYGLDVQDAVKGAGSAFNYQMGLRIRAQTKGTQYNYGIYIEAPSGAASGNTGIYNAGTSELDGNVGIGAFDPVTSTTCGIKASLTGQSTTLIADAFSTTSSHYAFQARKSDGVSVLLARGDGLVQVAPTGGLIGFFGAGGAAKQTVSGAKGSNAALGSLITALVAMGLVTDTTTA
jgi:hypothetical protein